MVTIGRLPIFALITPATAAADENTRRHNRYCIRHRFGITVKVEHRSRTNAYIYMYVCHLIFILLGVKFEFPINRIKYLRLSVFLNTGLMSSALLQLISKLSAMYRVYAKIDLPVDRYACYVTVKQGDVAILVDALFFTNRTETITLF